MCVHPFGFIVSQVKQQKGPTRYLHMSIPIAFAPVS